MALNNICRLCLAKENLEWIFSERNEGIKLNEVIYIATGIEVHIKDVISQKICDNCYVFTIKIFQFRSQCLKSDKYFKENCSKYLEESKIAIPNTEVSIIKCEPKKYKALSCTPIIHPSVKELCRTSPQIKLPPLCLKSHIAPVVCMELDEVENYFKKRKLDIKKYIRDALKSNVKKKSAESNYSGLVTISRDKFRSKTLIREKDNQFITSNSNNVHNAKTQRNAISNANTVSERRDKSVPLINDFCKPTLANSKAKSPTVKKIKLSKIKESKKDDSEQVSKKQSELVPKPIESTLNKNNSAVSLYIDKSVPLHICNICDSVQYSVNRLKKHQNNHTRCQFCKKRFRTLQQKEFHTKSQCIIKNTINKFPDVLLKKVEYDMKIRPEYPEAFAGFPPLGTNTDNKIPLKRTGSSLDEGEKLVRTDLTERTKEVVSRPDILKSVNNVIELSDEDSSTLHAKNETSTCSRQTATDHDVPIIMPAINIRDNRLVDDIDLSSPDTVITKELILKLNLLDPFRHKQIQTHKLITNKVNYINGKIVLNNLKHQLYMYNVRVIPKYGPLKISYEKNIISKKKKKPCLWNDLTPVDVKVPDNLKKIVRSTLQSQNDSIMTPKSDEAVSSSAGTCQGSPNFVQLGQQSSSSAGSPAKNLIRVKSIYKLL